MSLALLSLRTLDEDLFKRALIRIAAAGQRELGGQKGQRLEKKLEEEQKKKEEKDERKKKLEKKYQKAKKKTQTDRSSDNSLSRKDSKEDENADGFERLHKKGAKKPRKRILFTNKRLATR